MELVAARASTVDAWAAFVFDAACRPRGTLGAVDAVVHRAEPYAAEGAYGEAFAALAPRADFLGLHLPSLLQLGVYTTYKPPA